MKYATHLLVILIGFAAGWTLKPKTFDPVNSTTEQHKANVPQLSPPTPDIGLQHTSPVQISETSQHGAENNATNTEHEDGAADNTKAIEEDSLKLLLDSIEQSLTDNDYSEGLERDLRAAILKLLVTEKPYGSIPAILDLANNKPEVVTAMLDHIMDIDDQEVKTGIVDRFLSGLGWNKEFLVAERYIMQQLNQGEPFSKWLGWLDKDFGPSMQLPSTSLYFQNQLPSLSQPTEVVIAINGVVAPFHLRKGLISPTEKNRLHQQLLPYFDSNEPLIRAAAVRSLSKLQRPDQNALMERALDDEALAVREAAVDILYNIPINSPPLASKLLKMARDTNVNIYRRYNIMSSLQSDNKLPEFEQEIFDLYSKTKAEMENHRNEKNRADSSN